MAAGAERPGNGSTAVKSGPSFKRNQTNAAMLRTVEVKDQITVDFKDVCAWVPLLFAPTGKPGVLNLLRAKDGKQGGVDIESPAKDRQVLFDITGSVSPGEVLALMGPSGSGKSSLLSILGQRSTARTTGSILFNGEPLNKLRKRKLGYVQQASGYHAGWCQLTRPPEPHAHAALPCPPASCMTLGTICTYFLRACFYLCMQ